MFETVGSLKPCHSTAEPLLHFSLRSPSFLRVDYLNAHVGQVYLGFQHASCEQKWAVIKMQAHLIKNPSGISPRQAA